MPNVITIKGNYIRKERVAAGTITPGMLVEVEADDEIAFHSTAQANAAKAFADFNEVVGRGIDDTYTIGENVLYNIYSPGAEVNALLGVTTITRGDFVESAGDGTLLSLVTDAATDDTQRASVVGVALDTVTNGAGTARIRIEVL